MSKLFVKKDSETFQQVIKQTTLFAIAVLGINTFITALVYVFKVQVMKDDGAVTGKCNQSQKKNEYPHD